jgi:hypothetical protein
MILFILKVIRQLIKGNGLIVDGESNVIISGLIFRDGARDAVRLQGGARNVWIHRNTLSNFGDGLVDIIEGSRDVTVSWNRFENHNKAMIIGRDEPGDDQIKVTVHHNYFDSIAQRSPKISLAKVHAYNNVLENWEVYGMASTAEGELYSEANVFVAGTNLDGIVINRPQSRADGFVKSVNDRTENGAKIIENNAGSVFNPHSRYSVRVDNANSRLVDEVGGSAGQGSGRRTLSCGDFEDGFKIESSESEDGCISEFAAVNYGISLDEAAQCKVDIVRTDDFDAMDEFFGGSNLYKDDHSTISVMPLLDSIDAPGVEGDPDRRGDYVMFVRCSDFNGNENSREYAINFCVEPANDVTPPVIRQFIPESPGYAGLGVEEKDLLFYTNEPAECRWSLTDEQYEEMDEVVLCANEIEDVTPNGWLCGVTLPISNETEEQNYYFRCLDQPWKLHDEDEENDEDRNVATQSAIYQIIRTTEPLEIISVSPDDEVIVAGGEPVAVDLEIRTVGGIDGNAVCEYSFSGEDGTYSRFFESGERTHTQRFTSLFEGEYDIALQCIDVAENIATGNSEFSIDVDDSGPIITRVYERPTGTLNVVTNEASQCAYDFTTCGFIFENGTLMNGEDLRHTTEFGSGFTYHIKCQDGFGNVGNCLRVSEGY